jgi:alanyl-tRNA synthetase
MSELETFGKSQDGEFCFSKDSKIIRNEWLKDNDGKIVREVLKIGKPRKTKQQIKIVHVCIHGLATYLGYADKADAKRSVKESIGYYEIKETKNLKTGVMRFEKEYKSFADLKKDSGYIEDMFNLCDELGFPMREFYNIALTKGIEASKKAMENFLRTKI